MDSFEIGTKGADFVEELKSGLLQEHFILGGVIQTLLVKMYVP